MKRDLQKLIGSSFSSDLCNQDILKVIKYITGSLRIQENDKLTLIKQFLLDLIDIETVLDK